MPIGIQSKKVKDYLKIDSTYESLVPRMSETEYRALKESIRTEGQHVPIIVNKEHVVLDGHHRLRACRELGVAPKFEVKAFESKEEETAFVIGVNLQRRHLNDYQKAELGFALKRLEAELAMKRQVEGARKGGKARHALEHSPHLRGGQDRHAREASAVTARRIGISRTNLERAEVIAREASDEIKEKLRAGKMSIYGAYLLLARRRKEKGPSALNGQVVQISDAVTLVDGNLADLTEREIPSDSVHLIIEVEPLDNKEVAHLARLADRILKPGGFLVLCMEPTQIGDATATIRREAKILKQWWHFAERWDSGEEDRREIEFYFVYSKGETAVPGSSFRDFMDNRKGTCALVYEWLIRHLTQEGDVVCDPKCVNGFGGEVAVRLGRRFIGIETDQELFERAKACLARASRRFPLRAASTSRVRVLDCARF